MRLYETLRTFSRYACAVDPQSRLLPKGPGGCHGRTDPYIYSDAEAASMMSELASLHSPDGLRARSLPTMFGLMYSAGLRPSKCTRLTLGDYDSAAGAVLVRQSKFNRGRIVPLSDTAAAAVESHMSRLAGCGRPDALFVFRQALLSQKSRTVSLVIIEIFHRSSRCPGWPPGGSLPEPRGIVRKVSAPPARRLAPPA